MTKAQKIARIKNFSKLRIKGALATVKWVERNVALSEMCKGWLDDAKVDLECALEGWD